MRFLKLVLFIVVFVWPVALAVPFIPDRPIFEYTGDGQLIFFNTHSNELMEIQYKDDDGGLNEPGIRDIEYMMRCRLTGEQVNIDKKLIELVDHISDHFGGGRVEIISGYRSPELNGMLKTAGRGVAGRSLHMKGQAIDIRIPGVPTRAIRDYAASLKAGGVGYYSGPDFVHIDTGRVRTW